MTVLNKSNTEKASKHIAAATGLFADAHEKLDNAVTLLRQAEQDHREEAAYHAEAADAAKAEHERSARIRDRIEALLK